MPHFKFIELLVLVKIFKVFTIYMHWRDDHIGHVTWTIYININLCSLLINLIGISVWYVYSPGAGVERVLSAGHIGLRIA